MRVVIIEDEAISANYLESIIKDYDPSIEIMQKIESVENAVIWLSMNKPDLIFLDIHLADDISFKIFEHVEVKTPIIFTTAYDKYAIKAFKLHSIDYLLKPIDKQELFQSIDKFKNLQHDFAADLKTLSDIFIQQHSKYQERFLVSAGQKLKSIHIDDVAYFFAEQKVVFLMCKDGNQYIIDYTLDKLENTINPQQFFRINRAFIISFHAIQSMVSYSKSRVKIDLKPPINKEAIVSVERSGNFKQWLNH